MTINHLKYAVVVSKENSLNEAAKKLYISQPSLTTAIHTLEDEIGFAIFNRSKSGITVTNKGKEFLGYARAVLEQYEVLDAKYISKTDVKRSFSVSMQHYTFAVNAFVEIAKEYSPDEYELGVYETKTYEVIENVKEQVSEIGVIYLNDFNRTILKKVLTEAGLEFTPLFDCSIYAYMSRNNPTAAEKLVSGEMINFEELDAYPCLGFNQGEFNSAYYAEEVLSTRQYRHFIRVNDRATMLNLIKGLNGYTLCSGIICEDLNGSDYCAIKVDTEEKMTIGYISRKNQVLSELAKKYIFELSKYSENVLN